MPRVETVNTFPCHPTHLRSQIVGNCKGIEHTDSGLQINREAFRFKTAGNGLGTVMMTRIADGGDVFVHAADIQLLDDGAVSPIIWAGKDIFSKHGGTGSIVIGRYRRVGTRPMQTGRSILTRIGLWNDGNPRYLN